ncbi:MAG: EamA family transporter [Amphritea sp.]
MTLKDTLLSLVIVLVWGFNFVVIAWGLEGIPPLLMGGLRFLLVALIGSLIFSRPKIPLRWMIAYGMTLGFGQFAFLFTAMAVGMPAGLASLVLQSQALFTLVLAQLLLKETIKPHQVIAIMIAGSGLVLIGWTNSAGAMTAIGFGLTLAAAACWAIGNIINRAISQKGYHAGVNLVAWSAWFPPLPFFAMSYLIEGEEAIIASLQSFSLVSAFALIYLALIATILGYGLWGHLLSRYPAAQIAPLTLGVPVVGLSCAGILLSEQVTLLQWWGVALVLLGLGFNMQGKRMLARWV